ncbi:MAG: D-3-phosphoglycerate dehydrogenase [uncultured Quadrisphaera sp.]|uniref:D-3-phosphoglycerate dehydrogenase n=1 Tax=uncultured Quadrisphaera sp. TaxID=904978 RepID=A0A6J4Q8M6_9ACTN|nr:MAG: D-3-phosphoglycerate dehydrogenase [uncultured Quadrisphaera sp.]
MTTTVLAAGDDFVLPRLLRAALDDAVGAASTEVEVRELALPWPHVPFGDVAEVHEASGDEDQLIDALADAQVCVTQMAPLTRRVLEASPELRLFAVGRGGPVNANLEAATEHGVRVTFAPGRNATATAEYSIGLLLAAARRIPSTHAAVQRGEWPSSLYAYDAVGLELEGATVGLVGAGAIGGRVARILRAFGSTVLVHDPYADPEALDGVELVELDALLERSDVVSLHARLTEDTREMIDGAALARMRRGAVLVNCARGGLVDHTALADALRSGHLAGAGLDVFDVEPLPQDHPLRGAPGIVTTPHLAGASRAVAHRAADMVAEEVRRYLAGEAAAHLANPAVLR